MDLVFWGGLWTLIGLLVLITGQLSFENLWDFSKRQARIIGATIMVFGLTLVSSGVLAEMRWSVSREMALSTVVVFFVTVTVLFIAIATVKLVRWARSGR
jgi:hypothetical protein